ncbi:hypothetical protein [uncultured Chryseobacterium sp.]|nr:hypothetical protein [uncultured Chryseobacterium sp.]
MKNLKKLSRKQQEQINGASALIRCTEDSQCFGGACCNRVCVIHPCLEQ